MGELSRINRDVYTSYLFTMAKYDFSIYEKRIVYRLIDMAQAEIEGMLIKDNLRKVHKQQGNREVTMPIASILKNEKDENYTIAKKAFRTLACKGLEYEDPDIWVFINIIAAPKFDKKAGTATFIVFDEIWQCLLNFSKGYRKYELNTIMAFKSVYTMRMYELMSGQKTPLTFTNEAFESLCDRFKLPKTMRRPQIFEEKVLNMAKRELDEFAPYSFTYKRETIPWRGRIGEKIIGYTFYPVEIAKNRDPNLEESRLASKVGNIDGRYGMLEFEVSNLLHHLGFTREEINALENKKLFVRAQKELTTDGLIDGLERIRQSALRNKKVTNFKGYIINGLKTMLNEKTNPEKPNKYTAKPEGQSNLNNLIGGLADKFKF
jgi:hypothetical protein